VKLSNIAAIWWIRVRARLGQELLAVAGIAVGVSLLFAALVANTSLVGSFERTMKGVVGQARFQVTARGAPMNDATLKAIEDLPGVDAAAPVLEARMEIRGADARLSVLLIGVTSEFRRMNSALTRRFAAPYLASQRAVGLPTPLAQRLGLSLGEQVPVNVNGQDSRAPVGTLLQQSQIGSLINSPIALAPLRYAQELVGQPGKISRVFVLPENGREADVEAELNSLAGRRFSVHAADFEADLFRQASIPSNQSTTMFSIFSAMIGFLFAFSAVLLTVPSRRHVIADLLLEGYGAATTMKVMLVDALVLGLSASTLGIVLGDQVSRRLFGETPGFLELAFTFGSERIVSPANVLVAAAGGILASCAAVLVPTAGAVLDERNRLSGKRGKAVDRARGTYATALGALALAGGIVVLLTAPRSANVAICGLVLLTLAMLLLLPAILQGTVSAVDAATRSLRSVVPYIAMTDLRNPATRVRAIAVAATGAIAVFGTVSLQGAHTDLQRGLDRTAADLAGVSDVWLVAPGRTNLLTTEPFRAPVLGHVPGVGRIDAYRGGFLDLGNRRVWAFGTPLSSKLPIPRGQTGSASDALVTRRLREGGWAVVSAAIAREHHWTVGDRFLLPSPKPTWFRLAATSTNMGWPPGAVVVNADDFARAWGPDSISALNVTPETGVSPDEAAQALRQNPAVGGLAVKTAADRRVELNAGSRQGLAGLTRIAAMVMGSAIVAMAVAMIGLIWQRRPFLASVKLEGYSSGEVWRSLLLQAVVLIGVGCGIGAAFGLVGQRLLSRALTKVTGFPVSYSVSWSTAALTGLAITLVAVGIVAAFGVRAAQVDPSSQDA
jgi:putative ABC transport system permease protein